MLDKLSNKRLIYSFVSAVNLGLEDLFIRYLYEEIIKRELQTEAINQLNTYGLDGEKIISELKQVSIS